MDKKSKILLWFFLALIAGSVAMTYWRIMVKRDYVIEGQTDCDPYAEKCFVWECDPASTVEGEACTGDPDSDIWYFQVARRNASRIPLCDPEKDENCDPWICEPGEEDCSTTFCSEDQLEAQYASFCSDPVKYAEENPEEESECEEGDEECLAEEEMECDEGDTDCEAEQGAAEDSSAGEAVCEEGDDECIIEDENVPVDNGGDTSENASGGATEGE